jgi:YVTN family beta-propeller protein
VSVIDVATKIIVATIPVGRSPSGVAANVPGTSVYVLNALDNTVSVIDAATRAVTATVAVGNLGGNTAAGLAMNHQGTRVYVANAQQNTISVIDTSTNTVIGAPITVGEYPLGVAVSPSGSHVYVTNSGSNTLSIVSATTSPAIATLPVGSAPRGVAVHPSGGLVYVATRDGLTVVDPSTMTIVTTVPISGAHGVAASPDGRKVYVTSDDGNAVVVIDALTNLPAGAPFDLASHGCGISVTPDGRFVLVTNSAADRVSVIDASTQTVVHAVNVGSGPAALGSFIGDVPPIATAQSVSTPLNTAAAIVLNATDVENDSLTFRVVAEPTHGTLTGAPPTLTYTPATDYAGTDSFTFIANDGAADSAVVAVSITVPFSTETSLTSNVNPSSFGQLITLKSTVTSGGGTPTGTVAFFDGDMMLGTSPLNGGTASLTTSVSAGARSITAVYLDDGMFARSESSAWSQTVNKATGTTTTPTVSAFTPQYSDVVTFRTTFTPSVAGGPAPAKVRFKVGTQIVGDATPTFVNGAYQYAWTGQLLDPAGTTTRQMKPDFRAVTATFVDPNFTVTNPPPKAITIQKEDARVAYAGPPTISLGGSATGIVELTATVRDISAVNSDLKWDMYPGDIRNATVSFIDRSTNTIIGTVTPTLSGSDSTIGTATYKWSVNLGTAKAKSYTIGFIVSYYYNRNSTADNAAITITKQ